MRLLAVHADSLSCDPVHSRGDVEPEEYPDPVAADGCVGAFIGVETSDGGRVGAVTAAAATELRAASEQLNTERVVLVPTPHLVDDPAESGVVEAVSGGVRDALADLDVRSVPAGWHLELDLRTNGHPYAVRSRRVTGEDRPTAAARETEWFLADVGDGNDVAGDDPTSTDSMCDDPLVPIEDAASVPAAVERVVAGERRDTRIGNILTEHGLTTVDETAAAGGLRWTDRGLTMRTCVRALLDEQFADATPIRTPETYDPASTAIREHITAAGWSVDGSTVARRTLCPGHLSAFADTTLDADRLPETLWEVGECERPESAGPRRATLAEAHTATPTLDAALGTIEQYLSLFDALDSTLGIDRLPVVRVTEAFYSEYSDWIERSLRRFEGPAVVERGAVGAPVAIEFVASVGDDVVDLGWLRVDVDGPERFGVEMADDDEPKPPVIVHTAPVGTVESLLAAVFDRGIPTWLAPTQVRLMPVEDRHMERCRTGAETLTDAGVRADVDDRELTVGERIAAADDDRVPYYAVVGDRETASGDREDAEKLRVTDSETGRTEATTAVALAEQIGASTPLDRTVSRRGPLYLSDRLVVGGSE